MACAHTPPERETDRIRRLFAAAGCLFEAGELGRASVLMAELVPTLPAGPERARALQFAGRVRARSANFMDALELARSALGAAGDDAGLCTGIELDIAFCSMCVGDFAGALAHTTAAVAPGEKTVVPDGAFAEALAGLAIAEFMAGRGVDEERLQRALALEDPLRVGPLEMRPRFVYALLRLFTGNLDESFEILFTLRSEALERGQESSIPFLSLYLVLVSVWRGDLEGGARFAAECREVATLIDEPVALGLSLTVNALVDAYRGPSDRVRREAEEALTLFQQSQWVLYTIWPLWVLGFVELSLGDISRTDLFLRPLSEMVTAAPLGDPILGLFLPDEIEALIALGELDAATKYLEWLERGGEEQDRPWALATAGRCRGVLEAALGDSLAGLDALEGALAEHERLPMPFERARTLLMKGVLHRRRKEKRLADRTLREALSIFESLGTPSWADRARAELGRVGLRPRAPGSLTDTERRVAELAATGKTNREVADLMFISPRTVGNVLGRVYKKLGIGSRAELGATMEARSGADDAQLDSGSGSSARHR